ncbi:MAG: hypothetical protein GY807_02735 [Gammaproteobacteria bacterium]|nr:hypothetical protein [Gammaproteobacteria bacterium]
MRWQNKWFVLLALLLLSSPSTSAQGFSRLSVLKDLNLSDMIVTLNNGDSYALDLALVSDLYRQKRHHALALKPGMKVMIYGERRLGQGGRLKGIVNRIRPLKPSAATHQ